MRTRLGSVVLVGALVLAGAALVAPGAGAAPTWLPVVGVSASASPAGTPRVAVDGAGTATLVWSQGPAVMASTRPAGGAWSAPTRISLAGSDTLYPDVAAFPDGRAIAVWSSYDGANYRVQASTRNAAGTWTAPATLSAEGQPARTPDVVVDASGRVTATWARRDAGWFRVQASSRNADGTWTTPDTISEPGRDASDPLLAVGASGVLAVAWQGSDGLNPRTQVSTRAPGAPWSGASKVSPAGKDAGGHDVSVSPSGSATVVWILSDAAASQVQASTQVGSGWSPAAPLSQAGQVPATPPVMETDGAGNPTVAWTDTTDGMTFRVRATARTAGGAWATPALVSTPGVNSFKPQVTVAPDGVAHLTWEISGTLQGSSHPADGAWSAPRPVSGPTGEATMATMATDARGDTVVAWYLADGGAGIYQVQATALDSAGPIVTAFSAPAAGTARTPVALSVSAYDTWSAVGTTTWSFGDGTTATGAAVSHSWAKAGSYPVTATVTDAVGNTTTRSATVSIGAGVPVIQRLKLKPGTLHLDGSRKKTRTKVQVSVSDSSKLTLTFKKKGVKKPLRLTRDLKAGSNTFTLTAKLSKKKRLTVGKWKIAAVAQNAAGASQAKKLTLKVVR